MGRKDTMIKKPIKLLSITKDAMIKKIIKLLSATAALTLLIGCGQQVKDSQFMMVPAEQLEDNV